ncbi:hypothetical protein HHI36_021271 [Cryptolaemus montrouzieri]|uniref:Uncharacterized protein n=1 Tax=Cryptolaemus montrouzieri TaxID=559131 RepID=A0ABD2MX62_9CUCU
MKKKNFLKICVLATLVFAGILDLGLIILIGIYQWQFFWLFLILYAIFYCLGVFGTVKEYYFILYIFASYVIIHRGLDIFMRLSEYVNIDPEVSGDDANLSTTTVKTSKRNIIISPDGKCCLSGSENIEEYVTRNCCHDDPTLNDPESEICQKMDYGTYAYRCETRSGRRDGEINEEGKGKPKKTSGKISIFLMFYCLRTIIDVILLFLYFYLLTDYNIKVKWYVN